MENIVVQLPASLKDFVDSQTAARGFGDAGEYIQSVLCEEQKRKVIAEVRAQLHEGVASEPIEWNQQSLESLKQEIVRRHAQHGNHK